MNHDPSAAHAPRPRARRWLVAAALLLTGCPPDNKSTTDSGEQGGSKDNAKSGAGNDHRSLQDISGAERSKDEPRGGNREPGGR